LSPEHHGLALPSPNQRSHPMLFSALDLLQESQSVTVVKCGTTSNMLACGKMENLKDMSDRDTISIYLSICLSILSYPILSNLSYPIYAIYAIYLFIYLSIYFYLFLSIYIYLHLSKSIYIYLNLSISIYIYLYLSIYLI
jgi:hypothetical protein